MARSSADTVRKPAWLRVGADGSITLELHCQPGARRTEVVGAHGLALKIRVAAPAVDGRANEALMAYLATSFGVGRRSVELIRGQTGRSKTVRIDSPPLRPDREWGS
ncbi:MAG TPA: DUF167 domain-containing protein [Casimicrobiaceae bacterium]|nr:DUF167 domain-containing protein [Casimicrobiaceae bacterium]